MKLRIFVMVCLVLVMGVMSTSAQTPPLKLDSYCQAETPVFTVRNLSPHDDQVISYWIWSGAVLLDWGEGFSIPAGQTQTFEGAYYGVYGAVKFEVKDTQQVSQKITLTCQSFPVTSSEDATGKVKLDGVCNGNVAHFTITNQSQTKELNTTYWLRSNGFYYPVQTGQVLLTGGQSQVVDTGYMIEGPLTLQVEDPQHQGIEELTLTCAAPTLIMFEPNCTSASTSSITISNFYTATFLTAHIYQLPGEELLSVEQIQLPEQGSTTLRMESGWVRVDFEHPNWVRSVYIGDCSAEY